MNRLVLTFGISDKLTMDQIHQIGKLLMEAGIIDVSEIKATGKVGTCDLGNPTYAIVLSNAEPEKGRPKAAPKQVNGNAKPFRQTKDVLDDDIA